MKNIIQKSRQRGQGMVEYIIIVAVIALGSIAVYAAFGDVLRAQVANSAEVLNGQTKSNTTKATAAATKAKNNVNKDMASY
jgi:Flp pilus assembly pilin Flp